MQLLIAAGLALALSPAAAQPVIGLHAASVHVPAADWHNNQNPGLYLRAVDGLTVGGYLNTFSRPTFYVGRTWSNVVGPFDLTVAGATGYRIGFPVVPLVAASVELAPRSWGRVPRLTLVAGNGAAVFHLSIEGYFQ